MTIRVDSNQLVTGNIVVSLYAGHGVQAQDIPATGDSGPSFLYNDIAAQGMLPTDEVRAEILTMPTSGVISFNEDGTFTYTGPDGVDSFDYRGFRNGVSYGDYTVTLVTGFSASATVSTTFANFSASVAASYIEPAPSGDSTASVNVTFGNFTASVAASFNAPDSSASVSATFASFSAFVIAGPKNLGGVASVSASFSGFSASASASHNSKVLPGDVGTMPWQLAIANKRFIN